MIRKIYTSPKSLASTLLAMALTLWWRWWCAVLNLAEERTVEVELPYPKSRRWQRLPVAIPVFVRGADSRGKPFLEFTSMLNIGAGGALLAVHQSLPRSSRMVVEIPSSPLGGALFSEHTVHKLKSKVVHVSRSGDYDLLGVEFVRPLAKPVVKKTGKN